jgi:hypothetical protein
MCRDNEEDTDNKEDTEEAAKKAAEEAAIENTKNAWDIAVEAIEKAKTTLRLTAISEDTEDDFMNAERTAKNAVE